ncbi:MAG: hypothetical protein ATN35_12345 [Epulopiscium sp. Nele67-Bin004]|nr:MAG: hypothetical protein ATN35_12345 [Epulopiscium sp. Nele67-Bin004]
MSIAIDYTKWKEEIIDGKIYYMAPPTGRHNGVLGNLYLQFATYLKGKKCKAWLEIEVSLNEDKPNDYVVPDLSIICNNTIGNFKIFKGIPDLIVEVMSTNRQTDKIDKFNLYQQTGVKEYWLVDPVSNTIDQYVLENNAYKLTNVFEADFESELVQTIKPTIFDNLEIEINEIFEY